MNYRAGAAAVLLSVIFSLALSEPNGVVLYRGGKRLSHCNVPGTAEHHYFGYLEGPAWENKFSAFRYYIDKDDRNVIDIIGKFKEEAILQHFSDTSVDEHKDWPWGTDILKVNSAMGLGPFRLLSGSSWINPQIPETLDSLVVTIKDSSVQTPTFQIGYHGWNIGGGNKITAVWTVSTALSERPTRCELVISGNFSGKVAIGIVNHRDNTGNPNRNGVKLIQDTDPPLLATLGKQGGLQEGFADTLLLAAFADKSYFDSFVNDGTTNYGMALKPDADKKVKWSIAYSWARESNPIFRQANWKELLRGSTASISNGNRRISLTTGGIADRSAAGASEFFSLTGKYLGTGRAGICGRTTHGIGIVRRDGKMTIGLLRSLK
jgi:hypothetical protein